MTRVRLFAVWEVDNLPLEKKSLTLYKKVGYGYGN
jgi:hypothetical protein